MNHAGWPDSAHGVGSLAGAYTENDIGGRRRRRSRIGLDLLLEAAGSQLHLGADTVSVADLTGELNTYGTVPVTAVVAGNAKTATRNAENDIRIAVAINVSGGKQTRSR